jgi:multidrug resistance efflux pump
MSSKRIISTICFFLIIVFAFTACELLEEESGKTLKSSGIVEAVEVVVSSELGGRVSEVMVSEGDPVNIGDPLFRLEDDFLLAQRKEAQAVLDASAATQQTAQASVEAAAASLQTALAGLEVAQIQLESVRNAERAAFRPERIRSWDQDAPFEFDLPVWYFRQEESIQAAAEALESAKIALDLESVNFERVTAEASSADLFAAEMRLAEAQAAFLVADELLDRAVAQNGREFVDDYTQLIFDSAEAKLESAQKAYDAMLSRGTADDVLEVRARYAVAEERFKTAWDRLQLLSTGDHALSIRMAEAAVRQAEAIVAQAEANIGLAEAAVLQAEKTIGQAEAGMEMVELQMEKLTVHAAVSGVVMIRNLELGEVVQPGAAVMTLGKMDRMTITVYISEDLYGQINLDDSAEVTADSFPGEVFNGVVTRISDQAEYTPRNVQTEEDRRTTVFAIELVVDDPAGKLKPGMPTDVVFDI